MENNNILTAVIKLQFLNTIKKSNLSLKYLNSKIDFYEKQINILNQNKPSSFQKEKLKNYYNKINEYESKLKESYDQINEEMDLITELNQLIID